MIFERPMGFKEQDMAFSPLPRDLDEALREVKVWRELYRSQRTWVGLTDEEVEDSYNPDYKAQTRAIEAKLKEKNSA